ncbi:hypothetical protein D7V97_18035 [Corallococcus sp. CA053C]|uniref:hypothetical protein n=1 Tax=Corallococcus sp. CA053C TaxID=2316732 RepID=UPI000EDA992A|nr:hypothetical protein [Corallococcus sp. CA053C]RKH08956.1 hypothetical protein D7V97_18035 [Corallococcus sp. CA053C]
MAANQRVLWGFAAPRVGYLNVLTMSGFVATSDEGWTVHLSNEHSTDAKGQDPEAHGVAPERPLELFPEADLRQGHARAIRALADSF